MSSLHLLDPEIRPLLEQVSDHPLNNDTLPAMRARFEGAIANIELDATKVTFEEIVIPALHDSPPVRCLKYAPASPSAPCPAFLHMHGGGYVMGAPEMKHTRNAHIAKKLGIMVLSVDYRLAPEHPAPAALNDCYAALAWIHQQSDSLGINPRRVAVGGESAGGGLAASLALLARDKKEYDICFQHLSYPMLDDRTGTEQCPGDPLTGEFVWTRRRNRFGWDAYLGNAEKNAPFVPARAETLADLPPAWICTGALDLFRDENIDYAKRLLSEQVSTELTVYPGVCHGFSRVTDAAVSKRFENDYVSSLERGLS